MLDAQIKQVVSVTIDNPEDFSCSPAGLKLQKQSGSVPAATSPTAIDPC